MDGVVFYRLSLYFDYSDLQLFAIFIFEVDFSVTYLMSAENSVSVKIAFGTRDNAPRYKKPSYGPGKSLMGHPLGSNLTLFFSFFLDFTQ